MRRKKLPPDTRYKWNDPELPLPVRHTPMECDLALRYSDVPNWYNDPSYNWAEKKRKRRNDARSTN